jgi:hypothetical protein
MSHPVSYAQRAQFAARVPSWMMDDDDDDDDRPPQKETVRDYDALLSFMKG